MMQPNVQSIQGMKKQLRLFTQRILPLSAWRRIYRFTRWPPVKLVRFGGLRRLEPISRTWGFDRGLPIDRYYIEQFLASHSSDICGHVLEIAGDFYTSRFGGDQVTKIDVLHVEEGNPGATIVADLTCATHIPSDTFDCIVCTESLHCILVVQSAISTLFRILKPGGVLLVTIPGISQISRYDMDRWGDYWRFTSASAQRMFEEGFPNTLIRVKPYGNVLTAIAFLHGLAAEEMSQEELDYFDPDYEVLISVRAVKPGVTA